MSGAMADDKSNILAHYLTRLQQGDESARGELLLVVSERLTELTRSMLRGYRRLRRWEETDDVLQGALMRLHRALNDLVLETPRDFYRIATVQIRRELIDLARHYFGPTGHGTNLESATFQPNLSGDSYSPEEAATSSLDPARLAAWSDFHAEVAALPVEEREVFELVWYQGLKQTEAAKLLQLSTRSVLRRWQAACLKLHRVLREIAPGS